MNVEDWVYKQLSRDDEWADSDNASLRSHLFGDNEWSALNESEWCESYRNRHEWEEGMGG